MSQIIVLHRSTGAGAMQRELEELFRRQWGRPQPAAVRHRSDLWEPNADMYETEDAYIVLLELAGMRGAEISVMLTDDALFVTGRRSELHHKAPIHFHQLGINEGPFQCAVFLPGPVDGTTVEATYDDGLVQIVLPKRRPVTTHIEVQSNT